MTARRFPSGDHPHDHRPFGSSRLRVIVARVGSEEMSYMANGVWEVATRRIEGVVGCRAREVMADPALKVCNTVGWSDSVDGSR